MSVDPVPQEVVERCFALVRDLAETSTGEHYPFWAHFIREARAIAPVLPVPVDPDLLEAREVAAIDQMATMPIGAQMIRDGRCDDSPIVCCALAGIKRGRELALSERQP